MVWTYLTDYLKHFKFFGIKIVFANVCGLFTILKKLNS